MNRRSERSHKRACGLLASCLLCWGCLVGPARSQGVTTSGGYNVVGDSFYEHYGIHWGMRGRGFFFDNGGGAIPPQFGGFDPNADARIGFGGRNGFFNFTAGQGSSRSNISTTSMITLPNVGFGSIQDAALRPFVTGIVPVVGGKSISPIRERLERMKAGETPSAAGSPANTGSDAADVSGSAASQAAGSSTGSTANHGDVSVAEIRSQQAAEDAARQSEIETLIEQARGFEERGKPGVARIYYQQAAKRATGDLQQSLRDKVQSLAEPKSEKLR